MPNPDPNSFTSPSDYASALTAFLEAHETFQQYRSYMSPMPVATWHHYVHVWNPMVAGIARAEYLFFRAAPIYGGSLEIQRTLVAQRVLGMPRESY
jgi:alkylation response protein AidB-like acyl-CoA dehydrogenase